MKLPAIFFSDTNAAATTTTMATPTTPTTISLFGVEEDTARYGEEYIGRIRAIMMGGGKWIMGANVSALETRLAKMMDGFSGGGNLQCLTCANGTDALELVLRALDLPPDSRVLVPAFTFVATANAVRWLGYEVVPVDVDQRTFLMNARRAGQAARADPRVRACIFVSLYGAAPGAALSELVSELPLHVRIIEDAAQSLGAHGSCAALHVSQNVVASTTSFYPTKTTGCWGDGGAIFTRVPEIADRLRALRNHGITDGHRTVGINSRLDEIQAAIVLARLDRLSVDCERRCHLAEVFRRTYEAHASAVTPEGWRLQLPIRCREGLDAISVYTVVASHPTKRDALRAALTARGIASGVYYPRAMTQLPSVSNSGSSDGGFGDCIVAELLADRVFSLPMHVHLSEAQVARVAETLLYAHVQRHPDAQVDLGAVIGPGTRVWKGAHVMASARIGADCNVGDNCFVAGELGDRCRLQNGVQLYEGVHCAADVFLGPGVLFTNDRHPRVHAPGDAAGWKLEHTHVGAGANLGAGVVVRCGVSIGARATVGAGAVVTKNVPEGDTVVSRAVAELETL